MKRLALLIPALLLVGCDGEVDKVKKDTIDNAGKYTAENVFNDRPVCQETKWEAYEENGVKNVKYTCLLKPGKTKGSWVYDEKEAKSLEDTTRQHLTEKAEKHHVGVLKAFTDYGDTFHDLAKRLSTLNEEERDKLFKGEYKDWLETYRRGPDGQDLFERLKAVGYVNEVGLFEPLGGHLWVASRQKDEKIDEVIKAVLNDVGEMIDANLKEMTDKENGQHTLNMGLIDGQVASALSAYESTHPLSRTETVIWTWNKLDNRYDMHTKDTDYIWHNGEHNYQKLCLNHVIYSITDNINDPEKYATITGPCD